VGAGALSRAPTGDGADAGRRWPPALRAVERLSEGIVLTGGTALTDGTVLSGAS